MKIMYDFYDKNKEYFLYVFIALFLIQLLYFIYLYFKHDKEYNLNFGKLSNEIPSDEKPELVACLFNKKFNYKAYIAFFLHFFDKKIFSIEEYTPLGEKKDKIRLIVNDYSEISMDFNEKTFLDEFVKLYGNEVNINDLLNKEKSLSFIKIYDVLEKDTVSKMKLQNNFESKKVNYLFSFLIAITCAIFGLFYIKYNRFACILIFNSFFIGLYPYFISKMTKEGREKYLKWIGYKKYLLSLNDVEYDAWPNYDSWFKMLSYAYALNIGDTFLKTIMNKKPLRVDVMLESRDDVFAEFENIEDLVKILNNMLLLIKK